MRETQVWSLGWEDSLEKGVATHSSILAWRISWTEELGRIQCMGSSRVGHNWATKTGVCLLDCSNTVLWPTTRDVSGGCWCFCGNQWLGNRANVPETWIWGDWWLMPRRLPFTSPHLATPIFLPRVGHLDSPPTNTSPGRNWRMGSSHRHAPLPSQERAPTLLCLLKRRWATSVKNCLVK